MKKILGFLILCSVLAGCAVGPQGESTRADSAPSHKLDTTTPLDERYMRLAKKAEAEGRVEVAAILYRAAALANENDPAPRAASAELFEKAGEYKAAAGVYGQLATETNDSNYLFAAARNWLKVGDYAAAKAHYETAVVQQPNDWRGYNGLAVANGFMDRPQAALENYALAYEKAPDSMKPSVAMNWALGLMQNGDYAAAVEKLEALKVDTPGVRPRLALAYALAGRTDDAKRLGLVKTPTAADLRAALKGGFGDGENVTVPEKAE